MNKISEAVLFWFIAHLFFVILLSESYNAQETGTWNEMSPMPTARQEMPSAVLNGKIYVSGGLTDWISNGLDVVEVYDPSDDTWSTVSPMPVGLHHHTMTAVNGKLYVVGGFRGGVISDSSPSSSVFEYDHDSDTWTEKASIYISIAEHAAVEYNGLLYVFGGRTFDRVDQPYVLSYDPAADFWDDDFPQIPTVRNHLTAVVIDSLIAVIGGRVSGTGEEMFINKDSFEIFSPATKKWIFPTVLPEPRSALCSSVINGKIYVIGGEYPDVYGNNFEFDIHTNTWRDVASMLTPRHSTNAVTVDNKIYVIGGGSAFGVSPSNVNEVFSITATDLKENIKINSYELYQNYPNPFNPTTTIKFTIPFVGRSATSPHNTKLIVFDILGNEIATLVNETKAPGTYEILFDVKGLSSGIYFYVLNVNGQNFVRKMQLLK